MRFQKEKKCSTFIFHFSYVSVVCQSKLVISGRWPAVRAEKILTTFNENWPTLTPPYTKEIYIHIYVRVHAYMRYVLVHTKRKQ